MGLLSCFYLTICPCMNGQWQAWCRLVCKASQNAKLPFRSDQLICCAESPRQHGSGGANIAGLQDLEIQESQSDDDLQFEAQTSGTLICCTSAICTSRSVQPWHLAAVTTGHAAQPCHITCCYSRGSQLLGPASFLKELESCIRLQ